MKIITMAAWKRPDYFAQVIESMENADGIEDYFILVSIDGGHSDKQTEMVAILRESTLDYEVFTHEENLGCAGNTGFILQKGFERAEQVIHAEDDTIFHPDALRWFEYNLEKYEDDERIFSIAAFTIPKWNEICLDGDWLEPDIVGIRDRFTCHLWATWKRVWNEIDVWFGVQFKSSMPLDEQGECMVDGDEFLNHVKLDDKGSWANPMAHYWRNGRYEIAPHTSFSQNIGREGGVHTTPMIFETEMNTSMFNAERRVSEFDSFFVDGCLEDLT